ncbi:MAG: hypothetical protein JRF63_07880 [Deltaproteobacteria bacterium]|nr:hypothetical protein [Deltaproteobacteria bacterium]
MKLLKSILALLFLLAAACAQEPQPTPSVQPSPPTPIPGEPVLAIPGQREAPPPPPPFAPPIGDAGTEARPADQQAM